MIPVGHRPFPARRWIGCLRWATCSGDGGKAEAVLFNGGGDEFVESDAAEAYSGMAGG